MGRGLYTHVPLANEVRLPAERSTGGSWQPPSLPHQFHTVQSMAVLHLEQHSEAELVLNSTVDKKSLP